MRASSSSSEIARARISCSLRLWKVRMGHVPSAGCHGHSLSFIVTSRKLRGNIIIRMARIAKPLARGLPMRFCTWLVTLLFPALLLLPLLPAADDKKSDDTGITWKKTVLDTKFRAEGVAVADVNKDGKLDVLAGEVWYERSEEHTSEL